MNKRQSVARALACALACLLAVGLSLCLSGCGVNDEEQIEASVAEIMDAFKDPSEENLKPYFEGSGVDVSSFDENGIDIYEFADHVFKRFDYEIVEVRVDGDTGLAKLKLTNADLNAAMDDAVAEMSENVDAYTEVLLGENGEQQFTKLLFEKVYEKLDDESIGLVTTDATLTFHKEGDEWKVDESSLAEVIQGMYGGSTVGA